MGEVPTKDDLIRDSILTAAQQLFQEFGLAKTTMDDIARKAGKAKSSLYYYYSNKEDIIVAVIEREKQIVGREVAQAMAKANNAAEKLRAFAMARFRALRKRKVLYKIMSTEMQSLPCTISKIKSNYNEQELAVIVEVIHFGLETGEFTIPATDVPTVAYIINSALHGLEFEALLLPDTKPARNANTVIEKAITLLLNALS